VSRKSYCQNIAKKCLPKIFYRRTKKEKILGGSMKRSLQEKTDKIRKRER
jgi:hypothetical protein